MKDRKIQLADGETMTINDNEWRATVNRKEFNQDETEIVRITKHRNGMLSRIYVMRSVKGQKLVEKNVIVVSDNVAAVADKLIADSGMTLIKPPAVV